MVRASHRYREATSSNPVEVLISVFFFPGFLCSCINCVHNCEDHSSFDFIPAVLIYDLFHIHLSMGLLLSRCHLHSGNNVLHWEQSAVFISYLCYILGHTLCPLIKTVFKFKWNGISETSLTYMDKLLAFHTRVNTLPSTFGNEYARSFNCKFWTIHWIACPETGASDCWRIGPSENH